MKISEFVELFETNVKVALEESTKEKEERRARFAKTCRYALEDVLKDKVLNGTTEIITDNYATISKLYSEQLAKLVANEAHKWQKGVHWVNNEIATIAKTVLQNTYQSQTDKKPNSLSQFKATVASAPSLVVNATSLKGTAPAAAAKSTNANGGASSAAAPKSAPATSPKSGKTPHQSTWTDTTQFPMGDHDFNTPGEFSVDDFAILDIASNCCAYPKLELYLKKNYDIVVAAFINNEIQPANPSATSFTPKQVLNFIKAKSAKAKAKA